MNQNIIETVLDGDIEYENPQEYKSSWQTNKSLRKALSYSKYKEIFKYKYDYVR